MNKKVEEVKKGGFGVRQEIDKKLEIMLQSVNNIEIKLNQSRA